MVVVRIIQALDINNTRRPAIFLHTKSSQFRRMLVSQGR